MANTFRETIVLLRSRGVVVRPLQITPMLDKLAVENRVIEFYEGARFHEQRFKEYGTRLLDLADLVRDGLQIPDQRYQAALSFISQSREQMAEIYKTIPVILTPAATGPAPKGLASTGDGRMNGPWTTLGTPAISIPMPVRDALPLGLQLTRAARRSAHSVAVTLAPGKTPLADALFLLSGG
jgi:Asp-tRNA(Asn)/Glu-tRNA(Gln) amidotransferase A subunit family amidase